MSETLAQRVASKFLQALGKEGKDRDAVLHQLEMTVHRGGEMLKTIGQQHGFWAKSIAEARPERETAAAYNKIETLIKVYQREIRDAMGALEAVEEMDRNERVMDYPDSYER
jgi:hypothetical protein